MSPLLLTFFVLGTALLAAVAYGRLGWVNDRRRAVRQAASLRSDAPAQGHFDPAELAGLPAPARRYLERAIPAGSPLARTVQLDLDGSIHFGGLQGQACALESRRAVVAHRRGFVWPETIRRGAVPRMGFLSYVDGEGRATWSLAGKVLEPLKHRGMGPNGDRAMRNLYACKLIWLPTALLPSSGAVWEGIDESQARVTVTVDGEAMALTLTVDPEGRLEKATLQRWGAKGAKGEYGSFPYGLIVKADAEHGGYRLPSEVQAVWFYGEDEKASPLAHTYRLLRASFA